MVKPAGWFLDVLSDTKELARDVPISCYQVSGEFAMIHAAAEKGFMQSIPGHHQGLYAIQASQIGSSLHVCVNVPRRVEW
jgi:delta-aminolevulinic acid dehydratase/porphobilinogen synthase